jgi:hypothetical protein
MLPALRRRLVFEHPLVIDFRHSASNSAKAVVSTHVLANVFHHRSIIDKRWLALQDLSNPDPHVFMKLVKRFVKHVTPFILIIVVLVEQDNYILKISKIGCRYRHKLNVDFHVQLFAAHH